MASAIMKSAVMEVMSMEAWEVSNALISVRRSEQSGGSKKSNGRSQ